MLFTRKKITTIVDELTTFFFSVGSDDMVVKDENELILIGAMIDSAQVEICEGYATLNLFRAS